jgi:hypothetical protein
MIPKYEEDFYAWTMAEADLLRKGQFSALDVQHLIEELESMGASEKRQLVTRLAQLIFHLLKWQFQPDFREFSKRSWEASIQEQRKKVKKILLQNPSLNPKVGEFVLDSYEDSMFLIKRETPIDLKKLPQECPYTFDQLMDNEFYPE